MIQHTETQAFLYTTIFALLCTFIAVYFLDLSWIVSFIYTHVGLGGLAFVVGGITLLSKKGSPLHKLTGKVFYYAMSVSVGISLLVALMPDHFSPTLFHIAVLSLYFLIGGKRSLLFKKPQHDLKIDKILAITVIVISIAIIAYSVIIEGRIHLLRTVFGTIGIIFGALDLCLFVQLKTVKRNWLFLHLSKMIGGYAAAVTAFFVAQNVFSGYFNWFTPTVVAISYITYWAFKKGTFTSVFSELNT